MRADICRIAILHSYGGLYADLDVYPNRKTYAPASLVVQKVFTTGHRTAMKKWLPAKNKHNRPLQSNVFDMEVLIGKAGNPIFLEWLQLVCKEIAEKNYAKSLYWQTCKMRYIWHTTGPKCMTRFLRLPQNAEVYRNLKFLSCNHFKEGRDVSVDAKRMYDVLSFESSSYYGEKDAFQSLVGDGEGPMLVLEGSQPKVRLLRRFRGKRKIQETDIEKNCVEAEQCAIDANQGAPACHVSAGSQPSDRQRIDQGAQT